MSAALRLVADAPGPGDPARSGRWFDVSEFDRHSALTAAEAAALAALDPRELQRNRSTGPARHDAPPPAGTRSSGCATQ